MLLHSRPELPHAPQVHVSSWRLNSDNNFGGHGPLGSKHLPVIACHPDILD
ncbi:hypothetical protein PHLCEN_2v5935 [Hermanssonia centrifuga]|uniref:Uncharacterized protein n=1 Tax=Hermanssonia centrifuga TaxID=98765 RepID=A0A2R6P0W4_9APHY|nr:hypothetical protein PHLCEN_2v5935 [Hermanssonia centrifuga]